MNKLLLHFTMAVSIVAVASSAAAAKPQFECTVTSVHAIGEDGRVVNDTEHLKQQIGSRFSVDRKSGAIRGGYFINNEHSKSIRVVNLPSENSYYVIMESHGPIVMIGYLYIGNHRKGPQKPFTYTSSGEYIYSGFCRDDA